MLSQPFKEPLHVWVGLGFPRQLNSVIDAYQFAMEYCGNSPEQRAAIRALKAALVGDVDTETARGVFVAFAKKKSLIADDWVPPTIKDGHGQHVCLILGGRFHAAAFLRFRHFWTTSRPAPFTLDAAWAARCHVHLETNWMSLPRKEVVGRGSLVGNIGIPMRMRGFV